MSVCLCAGNVVRGLGGQRDRQEVGTRKRRHLTTPHMHTIIHRLRLSFTSSPLHDQGGAGPCRPLLALHVAAGLAPLLGPLPPSHPRCPSSPSRLVLPLFTVPTPTRLHPAPPTSSSTRHSSHGILRYLILPLSLLSRSLHQGRKSRPSQGHHSPSPRLGRHTRHRRSLPPLSPPIGA